MASLAVDATDSTNSSSVFSSGFSSVFSSESSSVFSPDSFPGHPHDNWTLIARHELQLNCRSTGQEIEEAVLKHNPVGTHPPRRLETKEIDMIFKPLITKIEASTRRAVKRERDEIEGEAEDAAAEQAREDLISERKAEVSEKALYIINGGPSMVMHSCHGYVWKRNFTGEGTIVGPWPKLVGVRTKNPEDDLDDVDDEEFLEHEPNSPWWHSFMKTFVFDLAEPYDQLMRCADLSQIISICAKHCASQADIKAMLIELYSRRITLRTDEIRNFLLMWQQISELPVVSESVAELAVTTTTTTTTAVITEDPSSDSTTTTADDSSPDSSPLPPPSQASQASQPSQPSQPSQAVSRHKRQRTRTQSVLHQADKR